MTLEPQLFRTDEDVSFSGQIATPIDGPSFMPAFPADAVLTFSELSNSLLEGDVEIASDGSFTYTPLLNSELDDFVEYSVTDGTTTKEGHLAIFITAVDDPLIAEPLTVTRELNASVSDQLIADDPDAPGILQFSLASGGAPQFGQVTINQFGAFTYTPFGGLNVQDSFTYSVQDSIDGVAVQETVTIEVNGANNGPTLTQPNPLNFAESDALLLLGLDDFADDAEGDPITFTVFGLDAKVNGVSVDIELPAPFGGSTIEGGFQIDRDTNVMSIGPNALADEVGLAEGDVLTISIDVDVFDIAADRAGGFNNIQLLTLDVSITGVNDAPVPQTTTAATDEDTVLNDQLVATDVDDENLTFALADSGGASNGSVTINPNGSFTYTPDNGFNGEDTFTYSVSDDELAVVEETVTVTVNAVGDPPPPTVEAIVVAEDGSVSGQFTTNLTNFLFFYPFDPFEAGGNRTANGQFDLNNDGSFLYRPNQDFSGADDLEYILVNLDTFIDETLTLSIAVNAVNDAPVPQAISASTDEDTVLNGQLVAIDVDGDDLTFALFDGEDVFSGALTLNADGSFTYTPNANFNGEDSFIYEVTDGNGGRDTQVLSITVNPVNDAPIFEDATIRGIEDIVVDTALFADDIDRDDVTLTIAPNGTPSNGAATITASQRLIYTPVANFFGQDMVMIVASDGNGGETMTTITLDIASANDAPTVEEVSFEVDKGASFTSQLEAVDVDGDALTFSLDPDIAPLEGDVTINSDGSFIYSAGTAFGSMDTFGFLVSDGQGGQASALASVTLNEPPNPSQGTGGADMFEGNRGADTFNGGRGNDTIAGGGGSDSLSGGGGGDEIAGGGGKDLLQGNGGRDILQGNGGRDTLEGGGGRDTLEGGGGRDQLLGGGGRDLLQGGGGRDTLDGQGGKDTMEGGNGRDDIIGGRGADILTGGGGGDRFIFDTGNGQDTITDFQQNRDRIVVEGGAEGFEALGITQFGNDVRIQIGNTRVTVLDDDADNFTATDFIF